jgi:alkanesulfonate monooxygenase SsuD/methylene tetrahydromethanopterin reductase-like flavin-dependent oxidoreductase (luciferase family)
VTHPIVIIAGLKGDLFKMAAGMSANVFAPSGTLILRPTGGALDKGYASDLLAHAREAARSVDERVAINVIVVVVAGDDEDDTSFKAEFFPFALYKRLTAPKYPPGLSRNRTNFVTNQFSVQLKKGVIDARHRADLVKGFVSKANMTPLLLPQGNFRSAHLQAMLENIYADIGNAADPNELIKEATKAFEAAVPYTKPPGSDRRCFTDGHHFFKTPGRHRHGYYRNSDDESHA